MRYRVRFGTRATLAGLALVLMALPFALLLVLVGTGWDPLVDLDLGASDGLHGVALDHGAFVTTLKVISTIGSAWIYLPLFTALAIWLAARGLRRVAAFVVVTVGATPILNSLAKSAVDRSRPVLPEPVAHAGAQASQAAMRRTRPSRPASSWSCSCPRSTGARASWC